MTNTKVNEFTWTTNDGSIDLERQINGWLRFNPDIEVMDIKYHTQLVDRDGDIFERNRALIIYDEEESK